MRLFGSCAALAAVASLVVGCSGYAGTARVAPSSTAPSAAASSSTGAVAATGGLAPSSDLGAPVGTRESTSEGATVKLAVYPLLRNGQTATLTLGLTLIEPRSGENQWTPYNVLGDKPLEPYRVNAVKLVDGKHKRVYLVARDTQKDCICSGPLNQELEPGDTILVTAVYAAPPADVSTIDVVAQSFGTIPGVPVR